ncbi:YceI family protein [Enemella sp. A6]|uniref:YceI family protein n=1 Tax=Enemella sp. A6 TaxID=3440152 RepID=UPI003EBCE3C5
MKPETGTHQLSAANGRMTLNTSREGVAGKLGHDLTIEVGTWTATVTVAEEVADCSVTATIDLTSLQVVDGTGGAKPLSDKDRREIVKNAAKSLNTGSHPSAEFTSQTISGTWDAAQVSGTLNLAGRSAPLELALTHGPEGYALTGTVVQTNFGIKPFSAMLGALKIADPVQLKVTATL